MKKILITGVNSFVGNSFANWIKTRSEKYIIEKISLRDDTWKSRDFSSYDIILHVAGIAHVSRSPRFEELYFRVNRDLTIELAKKAKKDGVKQFIFLSSIIVYGDSIDNTDYITNDTIPKPSNFYGMSKLQAEEGISKLNDTDFKIVIIRTPIIYGKGSKGNYQKLLKAAKILPIFPDINNQRSMIHIDNLCEFIRLIIENEDQGYFYPQNKEYVKTSEMVKLIAEVHNRRIILVKIFNPIINMLIKRNKFINKIFGNLVFDKDLSQYKNDYQIRNFKESIYVTER